MCIVRSTSIAVSLACRMQLAHALQSDAHVWTCELSGRCGVGRTRQTAREVQRALLQPAKQISKTSTTARNTRSQAAFVRRLGAPENVTCADSAQAQGTSDLPQPPATPPLPNRECAGLAKHALLDRARLRSQAASQQSATRTSRLQRLNVIDLFCGGGGFSSGLQQGGCDIIAAADWDADAADCYEENHETSHTHLIEGDIEARSTQQDILADATINKLHAVIGSPSCQSFSTAGAQQAMT